MKRERLWLLLAIVGTILPMSQFIPASIAGEFSVRALVRDVTDTRLARGVAADLAVAATTGVLLIILDGVRRRIRGWWIALLGTFLIGFSFGLPFYLYLRDRAERSLAGGDR